MDDTTTNPTPSTNDDPMAPATDQPGSTGPMTPPAEPSAPMGGGTDMPAAPSTDAPADGTAPADTENADMGTAPAEEQDEQPSTGDMPGGDAPAA